MEEVVLCGASAYNKKFYLNEDFKGLPSQVKDELKIMCVLFTEDIGGIIQLVFDEEGNLEFRTSCDEGDLEWIPIEDLLKLPMWEGDKIFLDLLQTAEPFFSLKLVYEGETLREAWLNERELP